MIRYLFSILLLLSLSSYAQEEKVANFIFAKQTKVGDIDNKERDAKRKGKIYLNESIRTGKDGGLAQIWTRDKAKFSIRENSHVEINNYLFAGGACNLEMTLHSGGIRTTTGGCGTNSTIKTPVGVITSLGTDHEIVYIPNCTVSAGSLYVEECSNISISMSSSKPGLYEKVNEGKVALANEAGEVIVNAGEVGYMADNKTMPKIIPMPDFFSIDTTTSRKTKKRNTARRVNARTQNLQTTTQEQESLAIETEEVYELVEFNFSTLESTAVIELEEQDEALEIELETISLTKRSETRKEVMKKQMVEQIVQAINVAPSFTSTNTVSINEHSSGIVKLSVLDLENDAVKYEITGGKDKDHFTLDADGNLRLKNISDFEAKDTYSIEVTAIESETKGGISIEKPNRISQQIFVRIQDINDAPTATSIANSNVNEDSAYSLTLGNYFTDQDTTDKLTYTVKVDGKSRTFDTSSGVLRYIPINSEVGTRAFSVTATDKSGQSITKAFNIAVANTNDAPTLKTAISNSSINEDSSYSYNISNNFADVDVDVNGLDGAKYTAKLSNGSALPSWLSIHQSTGVLSGTPRNGDVRALDVKVTRMDLSNQSISDTFKLTVANTNDAPTLKTAISNSSINEDSSYSYNISNNFADVDVDVNGLDGAKYTAKLSNGSALPSWLSIHQSTGVLSGTPRNGDVRALDVKVTRMDLSNQSISDTFKLTVANTNDAPTATSIANSNVNEDSAYSLTLGNYFTDQDTTDKLTYTVKVDGKSRTFDTSSGVLRYIPINSEVGTRAFSVTATDKSGQSITKAFNIAVANTNDAPTANSVSNQSIKTHSKLTINPNNYFTEVDAGDSLSYSITVNDKDEATLIKEGIVTKDNNGTYNLRLSTKGDYTVKLNAKDGSQSQSNTQFTTSVKDYVAADLSSDVVLDNDGKDGGSGVAIKWNNRLLNGWSVDRDKDGNKAVAFKTINNVLYYIVLEDYDAPSSTKGGYKGGVLNDALIEAFVQLSFDFTETQYKIPVNATSGVVFTAATKDQMPGSTVSYSLSGSDRFAIDSNGKIYLTGKTTGTGLNPGLDDFYDLTVTVNDGTSTDSRHVYVKQTDIGNDAAYVANTVITKDYYTYGAGVYLQTAAGQPVLDAGLGVTSFAGLGTGGRGYTPGRNGSSSNSNYNQSYIVEDAHVKLSNSDVYWGVWNDANPYYSDNRRGALQYITEIRKADDLDLKLPTTGTINYEINSKSKVYYAYDNNVVKGALTDADLEINFATNKADAAYEITPTNATAKRYLDILTLDRTTSNNGKLTGSMSSGVMMGSQGAYIGLQYNTGADAACFYCRGTVLFNQQDAITGLKMDRLEIQKIPVNTTDGVVAQVSTTDKANGSTVSYSLSGSDRFAINSEGKIYLTGKATGTGLNPGLDDFYDLTVTVNDGTSTDSRHVYVKQTDIGNDAAYVANTVITKDYYTYGAGVYLQTAAGQPVLDAGLGVTSFAGLGTGGRGYTPGRNGSSSNSNYNQSYIVEDAHVKLSNSDVYWGVWNDANPYYSDNRRGALQYITEIRKADDLDLKLPTTGTINYEINSKSKVYYAYDNNVVKGALTDADLEINFATNKADAAYEITPTNATAKRYLDILTLDRTTSNNGKLTGSMSSGVMMGSQGAYIGLQYNTGADAACFYCRGTVLFNQQDAITGLKMDRLEIQKIPVNTTDGVVAQVSTTDKANGSTVSYSLSGSDRFAINSEGKIYLTGKATGTGLNPGLDDFYDLTVTVNDGTSTDSRHVYVKQTDIGNDAAYVANTVITKDYYTYGAGVYLQTAAGQPVLDAGLGVTSFAGLGTGGRGYTPGRNGSSSNSNYNQSYIVEDAHVKLSNSDVYWGVWNDANPYYSDNRRGALQYITEIRKADDLDLKLPTTGTINYEINSKSKVYYAYDNNVVKGALTDADLEINFATNKADAAYEITPTNATAKRYLDILTLDRTTSNNGKLTGSMSSGVMMGSQGAYIGLQYNTGADAACFYCRGTVLFGPKEAKGVISDRVSGKNQLSTIKSGLVIDGNKVTSLMKISDSTISSIEEAVDSSGNSTITESGSKALTDNTIYWGRWSKLSANEPGASTALDDNPQLFMFETDPDADLQLPTTGTYNYNDIASTSVYDEQGNTGSLTDANMAINFATNAVTSQYQIDMGSGANWSNEITAAFDRSTGDFASSSIASSFNAGDGHMAGTLMGNDGSHAGAVYNVQLGNAGSSNMATGAVLFEKAP